MTDEAAEARPLLGVVPPPEPPTAAERFADAAGGIREAAAWTEAEVARLREARKTLNAKAAADAAKLHADTMAERTRINDAIKALLADATRYERLLRILDGEASA
jgi:phosphoenolpyruvate-protein kinase (PTS system EI component)